MTTSLWNIKNLEPPPITTCKILDKNIDLEKLKTLLKEAVEMFTNQTTLETEAALMSRCIYRMKLKLGKDKGFKQFEKVKRALLQYLRLEYFRVLENFLSVVPDKYECVTYFPSQNMLDYVLVRTQGVTKLLARVAQCAYETGYYMQKRMYQGEYFSIALINYSIVSRIFILTRCLVKYACNFFEKLMGSRHFFVNTANCWLPEKYEYPKNLIEWLDVEWMDDQVNMKTIVDKTLRFDYCDDSDIEYSGEYLDLTEEPEVTDEYVEVPDVDQEPKKKVKIKSKKRKQEDISEVKRKMKDEDVGEVFHVNKKNIKNAKTVKRKKIDENTYSGVINTLNHIDDIRDFIEKEKVLRKTNLQLCKYSRLSDDSWLILYNKVINSLEAVKNVKKGSKIRKCLENIKEELQSNL